MTTGITDINACRYSRKNGMYGGIAGQKDGIIYDGEMWLVKYPKNIAGLDRTGEATYSTSPLCEYIGSNIFRILGYDVHETFLGERHGRIVVACRDFATEDDLIEIRTIKNHATEELSEMLEKTLSSTGSSHIVDLDEILLHLEMNPILRNVDGITERFWEQAVVDIFINNNDRNNGNWGILRDKDGNDRLAPVFDNGGCLQTKISEGKIKRLLEDTETLSVNACNTQTIYGIKGHAISSARFLEQYHEHEELANAIMRLTPAIHERMDKINDFIRNIPETYRGADGKEYVVCSPERKKLYLLQVQSRLENLLCPFYTRIMDNRKYLI